MNEAEVKEVAEVVQQCREQVKKLEERMSAAPNYYYRTKYRKKIARFQHHLNLLT